MTFKKFRADVSTASQKATAGGISGVLSVKGGDSDGEVTIKYHHDSLSEPVRIHALAQDVSEYPDGNMFMLWTDDPDPAPPVVAAIKAAQEYLLGMSVYEMATELASRLEKEITRAVDGGTESPGEEDDDDEDEDEDEDDYDAAYDMDYPSDGDEFGLPPSGPRPSRPNPKPTEPQKHVLQRIIRDLRQVKQAGYKVGFLDAFGKTSTSGIVSISVRVDKLALSDEAMEAWDVTPTEYIVLLLRYEKQYDPLERVMSQPAVHTEVTFRIGKCRRYKPSPGQAVGAFAESNRPLATEDSNTETGKPACDDATFEKLFISNSLDSFLCESFISLLKVRQTQGVDWETANEFLLARIGLFADVQNLPGTSPAADSSLATPVPDVTPERHHVLGPDHLLEKESADERSLPLVAMQFAMRYFVRCTEYCLRCHRRLPKDFEALRPYVCTNPLCLFQYMAMGFGPSIEHEIVTEPYVVDLLVSLCYAAIQPSFHRAHGIPPHPAEETKLAIRELPVGLRLKVPNLFSDTADFLKARVSADNTLLVFEDGATKCFNGRLAPNKWLAFRKPGQISIQHARVQGVNQAAKTAVIEVMGVSAASWAPSSYGQAYVNLAGQASGPAKSGSQSAEAVELVDVFAYDTDFDTLDVRTKGAAMRHVLDTLPPILEIEQWLTSHPHSSFRSMERISPAAASLLQWIVSSNRSCIFQVDRTRAASRLLTQEAHTKQPKPESSAASTQKVSEVAGRGRNREHERIKGMDGWVQFRFAQGSPDKELRFNRALKEVAARKSIHDSPTIFAWHGSNLANWHSIVRTGLDFTEISCGRAFGHGVYFSPHHATSMGYASAGQSWPNSDLHITSCLSLNEIINAPDEFVSRSPHYVVSQLDWHQCRYLFVRSHLGRTQPQHLTNMKLPGTGAKAKATQGANGQAFYPQAVGLEVQGPDAQPLQIPLSAIPLRSVGPAASPPLCTKRAVQLLEASDEEDDEDIKNLYSEIFSDSDDGPPNKKPSPASSIDTATARDMYVQVRPGPPQTRLTNLPSGGAGPPTPSSICIDRSLTDFEPGSLDLSTLPRLQPPSFATDAGTRSLSRELMRLQTIQSKTPLHELGWYMDFDAVSNLFQWIVQLHTFDPALPLAKDMKAAGVTSVVMELRFGPDFPFSPPFVRVVRPRFLPFMEGGGGHVTAGGAMCMELLTSSGWSPASSMESVFLQVRMALCSLEPKPARLDKRPRGADYGVGEAVAAFVRAANAHGWVVPDNLHVTANGV